MAHILCMTTGLWGMVNASLEVVARLETAGHQVTYACPQDVRAHIEAHGIAYRQLPSVDFDPAPPLPEVGGPARLPRKAWLAMRNVSDRRAAGVERLQLGRFDTLLDELDPDLLLLDMELHEHVITGLGRGYRVVLMSQWFCSWRRPGLPPINSSIIPGRGIRGSRVGLAWLWTARRMRIWLRNRLGALRGALVDRRSVLRSYAKSVGLPTGLLEESNWPPPFTYAELPVISLASESLEFPHERRPRFRYVGPMVSLGRVDGAVDTETNAQVDALIRKTKARNGVLIVCTVTTMTGENRDKTFLARLGRAVRGRPEWTVVVGLGRSVKAGDLPPLPANLHAFDWIPQIRLLEHAALSIHHAGIHTINECMHFGVPMLVYSGGRYDQPGCAARIERARLGHVGNRESDDAAAIERRIDAVLADEALRERLRVASADARSADARGRLAAVIEEELLRAPLLPANAKRP